jgi:hypothetical protein
MYQHFFQFDGLAAAALLAAIAGLLASRSARTTPETVAIPVKVRENQ